MNIFGKLSSELKSFLDFLLIWLPGALGCHLRYLVYKNCFETCGRQIAIPIGSFFRGFENISLGNNIGFGLFNQIYAEKGGKIKIDDNVFLNSNVMINADINGEIIIENNVMIAPNVVIRASNHKHNKVDVPIIAQGHRAGKVLVRKDSWIGSNAVILPDVTIGKGAIVAAGAVVTKNVNDFEIVGGVPARKIGSRA